MRSGRGWQAALALAGIEPVHTVAFFSIAAWLCYSTYTGLVHRSDRRAAIAAAVVTGGEPSGATSVQSPS